MSKIMKINGKDHIINTHNFDELWEIHAMTNKKYGLITVGNVNFPKELIGKKIEITWNVVKE